MRPTPARWCYTPGPDGDPPVRGCRMGKPEQCGGYTLSQFGAEKDCAARSYLGMVRRGYLWCRRPYLSPAHPLVRESHPAHLFRVQDVSAIEDELGRQHLVGYRGNQRRSEERRPLWRRTCRWSCPTRHSDIKTPSRRCEEKVRQFERIRPANLQLQTETLLRRRALQAQPRVEDGSVYRRVWWS